MKIRYPIRRKGRIKTKKKRKRFKKPLPRIMVPSFFTLMNLLCGFLSILYTAEGNYILASWLIVIAGLFDTLDGFMARLSNATSDFGIELDSLSDIVSFGVAPGFLVYTVAFHELEFVGIMISALPPLCGAVRLARFNVDAKEDKGKNFFNGLPIPAQAIMIISLYLTFAGSMELFSSLKHGFNSVLMPVIILLSFLMVSTVPFDKIPRFDKESARRNKPKIVLFIIYLLLIILFREYGLILVFSIFIAKGLMVSAIQFWKQTVSDGDEDM